MSQAGIEAYTVQTNDLDFGAILAATNSNKTERCTDQGDRRQSRRDW
jgi:hypothetical protein